MSYLLLKIKLTNTTTTATQKIAYYDPISNSKEDSSINNEFSNGYYIRFWELVIVIFVIILWVLSLYRFIKHFDKLRITHHREIPYKLRQKDTVPACTSPKSNRKASTILNSKTVNSPFMA